MMEEGESHLQQWAISSMFYSIHHRQMLGLLMYSPVCIVLAVEGALVDDA
jgi:hypothetical protein